MLYQQEWFKLLQSLDNLNEILEGRVFNLEFYFNSSAIGESKPDAIADAEFDAKSKDEVLKMLGSTNV